MYHIIMAKVFNVFNYSTYETVFNDIQDVLNFI